MLFARMLLFARDICPVVGLSAYALFIIVVTLSLVYYTIRILGRDLTLTWNSFQFYVKVFVSLILYELPHY